MSKSETASPSNFITHIIDEDFKAEINREVITRFPPEPNGYLHIGHAKSICLNFGVAEQYGGYCTLRFDDTNPGKESPEYVESIKSDVTWLGFKWGGEVRYASNYFPELYGFAVALIKSGRAFVCNLTPDEMREYRGTLTERGKESPYRNRSIEENLDLFERMKAGEFDEGSMVLRAKVDMASPNINMRDPIIYRIRHVHHHQTGDEWCIYPTYDFTHGQSDAIEGVTYSICTMEFEDHRPLYNWFIENLPVPSKPKQYEFARLNLNYTITSKRKLKQLVDEGTVSGWSDPRMPTLSGLRRRGYTPASVRNFCEMIGVARADSIVDMSLLEFSVREDLDRHAPRAMCVLRPLKVVIENYPQERVEQLEVPNHPKDESFGTRTLPLTREIYIDQADFSEEPPRKWKRLAPGKSVRLRGGYVIECREVIKNEAGEITELRVHFDDQTLGIKPDYKVNGVVHWVSATESVPVEVRLYDRLFTQENPEEGVDHFIECLNPHSLEVLTEARAEISLASARLEDKFQFEREGYFCVDSVDSTPDRLVFNRTVGLRDSWAKMAK